MEKNQKNKQIDAMSREYEPSTMSRQYPIAWKSAKGVEVEDADGNKYIDFSSGVLISAVGHCHPEQVRAIKEQAERLLVSYNWYTESRVLLAKELVELAPENIENAFLLTTGAEAVETAVKAAQAFTGKQEIISFWGGYHGKTIFANQASGKTSSKSRFGPAMANVFFAPFPNSYRQITKTPLNEEDYMSLLEGVYTHETTGNVAAVLFESIQGNSGSIIPPAGFMKKLESWCKKNEVLMIADETQTAFGRCGAWFCFEHYGIKPNLIVCGKGLSSGPPITALLGEKRIFDSCPSGTFSSTHGGNPLSTVSALSSINIIKKEDLINNSLAMGKILTLELESLKGDFEIIGDVRGRGLMIGIEIVKDKASKTPDKEKAKRIVELCVEAGLLLITPVGFYGNVIRMAPPLVINKEQIVRGVSIFKEVIKKL